MQRKFDIGISSPLGAFRSGGDGNSYEIPEPKELKENIVQIDGVYAEYCDEEGTISIRTANNTYTVMPVGATTYSSSIAVSTDQGAIKIGDSLSIIGIRTEDQPVYIAVTIIRGEEKWIFDQVKSIYGRAVAIKNFYRLFKDNPGKRD